MRAFIKFNKGMMKMPLPWKMWLMLLVAANMVVPLFFIGRLEAQVILGVFMASAVLMTALTAPARIVPGHHAMNGSRIPPSHVLPLPPRSSPADPPRRIHFNAICCEEAST